MQGLATSDYRGYQQWPVSAEEEDEGYPLCASFSPLFWIPIDTHFYSPLVMKVRSRASSILSGASTPGGGRSNSLSEGDLLKADAALSSVHEAQNMNGVNGKH